MAPAGSALRIQDVPRTGFARDVIAGLTATPKRIPPKYFYDEAGCRLFERITEQPEYYLTRVETALLEDHAGEIAGLLPPDGALVEFGMGTAEKARILLAAAPHLAAYVPIDIAEETLKREAATVQRDFPRLRVVPVVADFAQVIELPEAVRELSLAGFFPGSTIGNLEPHEACAFLQRAGRMLGPKSLLIIGVDLVKDASALNAAYNDAAGVTAAFNLNILTRINRELGGNFRLECFEHHAFFNRQLSRVEMHLASLKRQKVKVDGETIDFRAGETIHTENSYKYTLDSLRALARGAGWQPAAVWTDSRNYFAIEAFRREDRESSEPAASARART
ncbi:MAG TPA: L-histidine N(alpha)-methyltransferase [Xanthobacteraceae bacterium]|nr:L-histidine N(alpha)-methyltransferase [Xanthobacteraceae bacterium]